MTSDRSGDEMDDVTTETRHPSNTEAALAAELAETTAALITARRELETLRVTHEELRRAHEDLKSSTAFRMANRLWSLRNALRRR